MSRRVLYYSAGDDPALKVVLHAIRQRQRGRQPACSFAGIYEPREALYAALLTLGFNNLAGFQDQRPSKEVVRRPRIAYPEVYKTTTRGKVPFDLALRLPSVEILFPQTARAFRRPLDRPTNRPTVELVIRDCAGQRITVRVRLNHDLMPDSPDQILMRGRTGMFRSRRVWLQISPGYEVLLDHGRGVQVRFNFQGGPSLLELL